jgi:gamma-glutamylputrescine oxidase
MGGAHNLLYSNDREGEHAPSLYAAQSAGFPAQPALAGDVGTDVCIIGAGFTGLSAALHLAQRGYRVRVLEAHRVGWGASGRNGGQVGSGQRMDQAWLEKRYGNAIARQYWDVAEDAKALVRQLISEHAIDCHPIDGILHANHRERYVEESHAYAAHLQNHYGYGRIRSVSGEEMRALIKSDVYFGGDLDEGAFHLDPLALAQGIGRAALAAGAVIHEASEATDIKKGKRVQVATASGRVTADHLLLACNGYLGGLEPTIAGKVLPINNFIVTSEPLSGKQREDILPARAAVADSKFVVNYFRITHDNRLLFGGGENYGYRFPADIKSFVRKPMLETFPQMKDVPLSHGWGGTLAITMKRLPLFERVSGNILNCSGYSGHGVALATMAGKIAAGAIGGQAERFDLMANLDTPRFPGGTLLRYPMLIAAMTWFSLRDKF